MKNLVKAGVVLAVLFVVLYVGVWKWMMSRVYVDPGEILAVTAKFGAENEHPDRDRVVEQGTKGVWKDVFGEGRYFFNPIQYATETRDTLQEIGPEEIGLVESQSGRSLAEGEFLADEGEKGIMRRPLTPGKWRLNPFAFNVTKMKATRIDPGTVGVVTRLSGEFPPEGQLAKPHQRGVQEKVLQPGIYYLNPRDYKVEAVPIGYSQITLTGVTFPSSDGFEIKLDISVVWGLYPKDTPVIIDRFGNVEAVVDKIIRPQVESICRIEGSKYGAKDFIEGTTREQFQNTFTQQFVNQARIRNIDVLIGLVRDINVPLQVREPIQNSKIAAEEQLTKDDQRKTQMVQNDLEELKAEVKKGVREVAAETEKIVAETKAEGDRKVATTRAEKEVSVAEIRKKVAGIEAERQRILGKAEAEVTELLRKAEADKFKQNVQALGDPEAYASYIFVQGLPDDLRIFLRYAGPGTFWTDLPGGMKSLEDAAARKILERSQRDEIERRERR